MPSRFAAAHASRAQDFSESLIARLKRYALALGFALLPKRILTTPFLFFETAYGLLRPGIPRPDAVWCRPPGYAGPLHENTAEELLAGMRAGFYQMSNAGPRKWWAPPLRAVMLLKNVHVPKRFRRSMKNAPLTVTVDQAFYDVVFACAAPRRLIHVTWLYPATRQLMQELFETGHAHSVEVWNEVGELVGGVFGVSLGPVFSALSMFHTANDASKLAIISLYQHLEAWGFSAVDHQMLRPWVENLGAAAISHADFLSLLEGPAPERAGPGRWNVEFSTAETAAWIPGGNHPAHEAA